MPQYSVRYPSGSAQVIDKDKRVAVLALALAWTLVALLIKMDL